MYVTFQRSRGPFCPLIELLVLVLRPTQGHTIRGLLQNFAQQDDVATMPGRPRGAADQKFGADYAAE